MPHLIYDETGMITQSVNSHAEGAYGKVLDDAGHTWLFDPHFKGNIWEHHVVDGKVQRRPTINAQVSVAVVSGLPVPCKARIYFGDMQIADVTVDDGEIDLTGQAAGAYRIDIEAHPHLTTQIEVTV